MAGRRIMCTWVMTCGRFWGVPTASYEFRSPSGWTTIRVGSLLAIGSSTTAPAVERVSQPGLQPPPVGVHLDQPTRLGLLHRRRIGQFRQQRHSQRFAERQHLHNVTQLVRKLADPGRHQLDDSFGSPDHRHTPAT